MLFRHPPATDARHLAVSRLMQLCSPRSWVRFLHLVTLQLVTLSGVLLAAGASWWSRIQRLLCDSACSLV